MANVNTNSAPLRLEAGGAIEITPVGGSDTYVLKLYEAATLQYTRGGYTPLPVMEFDKLLAPLRGAERPGRLQFTAKYTGFHDAEDLAKILSGKGANGNMKLFNIKLRFRENADDRATAGQSVEFVNCYVAEDGVQFSSGDRFDTIQASFVVNAVEETTATITFA